jgi:hypothetical protein
VLTSGIVRDDDFVLQGLHFVVAGEASCDQANDDPPDNPMCHVVLLDTVSKKLAELGVSDEPSTCRGHKVAG